MLYSETGTLGKKSLVLIRTLFENTFGSCQTVSWEWTSDYIQQFIHSSLIPVLFYSQNMWSSLNCEISSIIAKEINEIRRPRNIYITSIGRLAVQVVTSSWWYQISSSWKISRCLAVQAVGPCCLNTIFSSWKLLWSYRLSSKKL